MWLDSSAVHDDIGTQIDDKAKYLIYKVNFILD